MMGADTTLEGRVARIFNAPNHLPEMVRQRWDASRPSAPGYYRETI